MQFLCGVVGCFRSEKPSFREVGPPEQSQSDLRRSLAQPRPSAVLQNKPRMPQTHFFVALHFQRQGRNHHITTSLRFSIGASPSLLPAWDFGVAPEHPSDPKSDSLPAGTGKSNLLQASGAPGMKRADARFVGCQGKVLLHLCALFKFYNIVRRSLIGRKVVFFTIFSSSMIYIIQLRNFKFLLKTGPHHFKWAAKTAN